MQTAMSNAFGSAKPLKKVAKPDLVDFTDLSKLTIFPLQQATDETKQLRLFLQWAEEWSREAAKKIVVNRRYAATFDEFEVEELPGKIQETLNAIREQEEKMMTFAKGKDIVVKLDLAVFLEEIDQADPQWNSLLNICHQACERKAYRPAEKTEWLVLRGKATFGIVSIPEQGFFVPTELDGTKRKKSQNAIVVKVVSLLKRTASAERQRRHEKLSRMLSRGSQDAKSCFDGVVGKYAFPVPADKERNNGEGVIVLDIRKKEVESQEKLDLHLLESAGGVDWLSKMGFKYIPFKWFRSGVPDGINDELKKFAKCLIAITKKAISALQATEEMAKEMETREVSDESGVEHPAEVEVEAVAA